MPYLEELDSRGYRYYFQYTILGYPREIERHVPPLATAIQTFCELSERLGSRRVIWRDDPIVFTGLTSPAFHRENFQRLAESLQELHAQVGGQHRGHVPEDGEPAEGVGRNTCRHTALRGGRFPESNA